MPHPRPLPRKEGSNMLIMLKLFACYSLKNSSFLYIPLPSLRGRGLGRGFFYIIPFIILVFCVLLHPLFFIVYT